MQPIAIMCGPYDSLTERTGDTDKHLCCTAHSGMPDGVGTRYHIDSHPRFRCADRFVVYTTMVRGRVEVATVKTEDLIDQISWSLC